MKNHYKFPKFILDNICCDFTDQSIFESIEEFEQAVKHYNIEAFEDDQNYSFDDESKFQEIALEKPVIVINYYADSISEENGFYIVKIESDNKTDFSNRELFYKIHNAIVNRMKDEGHCYFEGLEFVEVNAEEIPVYEMIGGS